MPDSFCSLFDKFLPMRADKVLRQPPAQDFVGAFRDARAADLAIPPFERQLFHQSQAAVNLDRSVDDAARHLSGHDLYHVRKIAHVVAVILAPGAFVDH